MRMAMAASLRVGAVMAIPAVLEDLGCDATRVLAEFGIQPAYFDDPENTLPYATVGRILGRCVDETGCRHFGLLVGERAGMPSLGAVGYLMQSAPDVGTALGILRTSLQVHDRGAVVTLKREGSYVALGYANLESGLESSDQIHATAITVGMSLLRGLCGFHWRPSDVQFAFAAPRDVAPYRKFFQATPRFDAARSALVFPGHWLARPLPSADPFLHRLMRDRVNEMLVVNDDDLVAQLRRFLRTEAMSAVCTLEVTARHFGMHSRALSRRLAKDGTGFQRLRDEVCFDSACQFLRNTRLPVNEIASTLGYADGSAFNRAFRRWAGMAPAAWRIDNGRDSGRPARAATRGRGA
jgi:AraC-like DNA-binding protein